MENKLPKLSQEVRNLLRWGIGRRNTFGDKVIITDEIEVWNGKNHFKSKGHMVNQGLIDIINICAANVFTVLSDTFSRSWTVSPFTYGVIRLGTDTTHATGGATVGNTSEIATDPNSQAGATANPSANVYRISWIATWNAGTISGTIGEMGLFLNLAISLIAFLGTRPTPAARKMFSRLSVADGDFTAFTINTAVPLTIEWRLMLTFA